MPSSSPVTSAAEHSLSKQLHQTEAKESTDNKPSASESSIEIPQEAAKDEHGTSTVEPPTVQEDVNEEQREPAEVDHPVDQPTNHNGPQNMHLAVAAQPLGRSSRYTHFPPTISVMTS